MERGLCASQVQNEDAFGNAVSTFDEKDSRLPVRLKVGVLAFVRDFLQVPFVFRARERYATPVIG